MQWLRNLLAPRYHDGGGTAMYRESNTRSDNAANFIFEPTFGPPMDPPIRGYQLGQGPGITGASAAPLVQLVCGPIGAGYAVGTGPSATGLVKTPNSLDAQENI